MFNWFKRKNYSSAKTFGCFMRCKRCPNKKMDDDNKYCIHLEACEWSYQEGIWKRNQHRDICPVCPGDIPPPDEWIR